MRARTSVCVCVCVCVGDGLGGYVGEGVSWFCVPSALYD